MRKHAALLVATLFTLASGSALALGDRNKDKKAADKPTATQTTPSSGSGYAGSAAADKGDKRNPARTDMKCDESQYASRSAMPKECFDKSGTGAAEAGSTTGQSPGASSGSGTK
jgi:hypothetical protein